MHTSVFDIILQRSRFGVKSAVVLLDPDNCSPSDVASAAEIALHWNSPFIMVGGSLITGQGAAPVCTQLKNIVPGMPTVLFPGSAAHFTSEADALLLLSLISGRNPEFLIGQHVTAAFALRSSGIELIPTAYVLVDGGRPTTVSYISNTTPLPADKPALASATALAGTQLGLKLLYLDAGSGALNPVSADIISAVKAVTDAPLVVGGGINTPEKARIAFDAGADVVVLGNVLEKSEFFDVNSIKAMLN